MKDHKVLIVDLDPGIRYCQSNTRNFIEEPHDQALVKGCLKALDYYEGMGWNIYGVTNQGGVKAPGAIGSSFKTFEDCVEEQSHFMSMAPMFKGVFFAPGMEGDLCYWVSKDGCCPLHESEKFKGLNYRQPGSGMIEVIKALFAPNHILFVGSRVEDLESAKRAEVSYLSSDAWIKSITVPITVLNTGQRKPEKVGVLLEDMAW